MKVEDALNVGAWTSRAVAVKAYVSSGIVAGDITEIVMFSVPSSRMSNCVLLKLQVHPVMQDTLIPKVLSEPRLLNTEAVYNKLSPLSAPCVAGKTIIATGVVGTSVWQVDEQPSPFAVLLSSQVSPISIIPFPQTAAGLQSAGQLVEVSPIAASHKPSPQNPPETGYAQQGGCPVVFASQVVGTSPATVGAKNLATCGTPRIKITTVDNKITRAKIKTSRFSNGDTAATGRFLVLALERLDFFLVADISSHRKLLQYKYFG